MSKADQPYINPSEIPLEGSAAERFKNRSDAFWSGMRDAAGAPAMVLFAGMVGFGAMGRTNGVDGWFTTLSSLLMFALPGQTLADLTQDIETALSFKPPHISIYHLTIEPNTMFAKHPPVLPEDDDAYAMMDLITEMTGAAGLQRYEVSAYAKPGHRCWHNLNYWQFGDYLGIGAGAHSKLSFAHRVVRQVRFRDPARYMEQALAGNALAQDIRSRGHDYACEVIAVERVSATLEIAAALGLHTGASVFHSVCVHKEDGVPMQLEDRYVNPAAAPDYLGADFTQTTPTRYLLDVAQNTAEAIAILQRVPVTLAVSSPNILVVNPALPVKTETSGKSRTYSSSAPWPRSA